MSGKKWFLTFLGALLLSFVLWAGLNLLVDPFNAFGDVLFGWDAYSQTLNPRNGKAVYISQHFDEYDSYIIGSSSAASYLPETLNGYLDASFYNMFHYGADTAYDRELVSYLLENDDVKYILLVLGLSDAAAASTEVGLTEHPYYRVTGESPLSYYGRFLFASPSFAFEKLSSYGRDTELPQPFDVFLPESGSYDKRVRDVEPIGSLTAYLEAHGGDFPAAQGVQELENIETCAGNVAEIRRMCAEAGAELIVVMTPACQEQLERYSTGSLDRYYAQLAQVTDYWNFAISPVSHDPRYFYDLTHTRNAASDMVLARIFGDETAYYPESFGVLCRDGAVPTAEELEAGALAALETPHTETVPILLYHHLAEEGGESDTTIYPETFERHMRLLAENGYTPVSLEDLIAFVEGGEDLPQRPVVITFDDGYLSNYEYAYPILQEYGFPAVIFAIGCSIGHEMYYKDTEHLLTPHFGEKEIQEMTASGLISIHSHTYDMHQWAPFEEGENVRENILPLEGESEGAYIDALTADVAAQDAAFAACGLEKSDILAFPGGRHATITDVVLRSCGYKVTLTTDPNRVNTLVRGLPQSLVDLGRLGVGGATTDEEILAYLARAES